MKPEISRLLAEVPDVPEWALTRYILSSNGSVVSDASGSVVLNADHDFLSVIGVPEVETIRKAIALTEEEAAILVQPDAVANVQAATGLPGDQAELHTLIGDAPTVARNPDVTVRLLDGVPDTMPESDLREELEEVLEEGKVISATWMDNQPVAFCYSVGESERYWDVSVDTVEAYRRRGLALQAFLQQYAYWQERNREPIWGAAMSNEASRMMALKLGFQRIAEIWEFEL